MSLSLSSPDQLGQLANVYVRVAVAAGGAPVVEVVSELSVASHHEVGFEARACQAVVLKLLLYWYSSSELFQVIPYQVAVSLNQTLQAGSE